MLIHHAIHWTNIGKRLLSCLQLFSTLLISIKLSDIWKCLRPGVSCSLDGNRCALSSLYSCVFCPSVFVGGSTAESMPTLYHLGCMENNVNFYLLPNLFCFFSSTALFFSNWKSPCALMTEWVSELKHLRDIFRCGAAEARYKFM